MQTATIDLPPKLVPILSPPRGSAQYRGSYGGRGSGKSYSFALMAAVWGYAEPLRILATREIQASIRESFHAELKAAIEAHHWLSAHYEIGVDYLRGRNGTEFIFRGLRHNAQSIKSLAKVDLTIVEEAEDVPEASWLALEATVFRQPKSELWAIWNPCRDGSPVDARLRKNPPPGALIAELNWNDNPFFPAPLETLRRREQERLDPATYAWVWEGAYLENSDAQVFAGKWRIADFEPSKKWDGPYCGGDFGFANDPTAAVECWIHDDCLYIHREAFKVQLELDDTVPFVTGLIPSFLTHKSRWDNARPESISYLRRHGMPSAVAVDKWKGSVEDGIKFMRSFRKIIVHPRCRNTAREMRLYSYKKDRLTGDVLPQIVDSDNHGIDAIRYALSPMITRSAVDYRVLARI